MVPIFTFFAVDKGNMTLIQFPNGVNMMVDCHLSSARPSPLEYLKSKVTKLDIIAITHPHQDHLTGLKEVCEHYKPKTLFHNNRYFKPDPVYEDWSYYEKLRTNKINFCSPVTVSTGFQAKIGDTQVYFLGPPAPHIDSTTDDENNNGIIISIVSGKAKIVLAGDTQKEQWDVTDVERLHKASIFLASHHGRENGFSQKAMAIINPQHIIISDGEPGETDATDKYEKIAPVTTTRERSITIQPTQESQSYSQQLRRI